MRLNIINLEGIIYKGEISSLTLPGILGEMTILPEHAPLITPLKTGKIRIKDKGGKETFIEIEKGVLEVKPDEANVLV